ncbi:ABC transporter substrate-binding protein [Roseomonas sp. KE2513]|uniref:molybdate ABC transporter substrate-binding protein n=1 Tax=Roseomonas sp. KE2513 TaxID=2479202 RepID=UPI0018DF6B76|nr:substrate-binding domain-containing protein [Roseomonas sp. KE2513]MBI0535899.1 ABC transporter substrate-binding protein [Roseomonas sp. KE2513]
MIDRRILLALSLAPTPLLAQAASPLIFAAGATKHAVEELQEALRAAGRPVPEAAYDTVGALRDRVLAGERPAVVLLSAEAVSAIAARTALPAEGVAVVGRTGVGLAAPAGRNVPDVSTPEALRAALLAAETVAVADPARGATAGRHFMTALDRLGIAEAMRPKLRLVPFGVEGVAMAARGEVPLAVSQATEITDRPGVQLVGLLPDALQLWTVYQVAMLREDETARGLMRLLTSEAARAAFARIGFRPPA